MIRIVICDDNLYAAGELAKLCDAYICSNNLGAECIPTTKPTDIFALNPDILFLDIEMPEVNGIEIKNQMEEYDMETFIIFVSGHSESMRECFGKNVIGFLTKPLDEDQFELMFDKAMTYFRCSKMIAFDDESVISSEKIVMIKVSGNYTDVIAADKVIKNQRKTLKAWMNELDPLGFIRISDSHIVNCRWITGFSDDKKEVNIIDHDSLKVTERRRKECIKKYTEFCKNMMRYL